MLDQIFNYRFQPLESMGIATAYRMWNFPHNLFYTAGMQDTVRIIAGVLAVVLVVIVILRRRSKKRKAEDDF